MQRSYPPPPTKFGLAVQAKSHPVRTPCGPPSTKFGATSAIQRMELKQPTTNQRSVAEFIPNSTVASQVIYEWRGDTLYAFLHGKKVGEADVVRQTDEEDPEYWLYEIEVDGSMQRQGIGSHLIRLCVARFGIKFKFPTSGNSKLKYFLTTEGAALMNSCVRKRIVTNKNQIDKHKEY